MTPEDHYRAAEEYTELADATDDLATLKRLELRARMHIGLAQGFDTGPTVLTEVRESTPRSLVEGLHKLFVQAPAPRPDTANDFKFPNTITGLPDVPEDHFRVVTDYPVDTVIHAVNPHGHMFLDPGGDLMGGEAATATYTRLFYRKADREKIADNGAIGQSHDHVYGYATPSGGWLDRQ